mgnify:CR=1 FL=1
MKKCLNCKKTTREDDIYCRNCGYLIHSNSYYVFINVMIIIISLMLLFIVILFITSYIVD